MAEQPHSTGAIFLSYASEDADAAARICESLRAAGIEVWFDKNELRGGDAWDSKIKRQIHDCALFMPVISANTNARIEGYFRGEWTLATRRLVNRAHDAAFLVPVVVDDTREADARVPEEFLQAQWTCLPGGEASPAFALRVRQLLGLDQAPRSESLSAVPGASRPDNQRPEFGRLRAAWLNQQVGVAIIALLLLGGGLLWFYRDSGDAPIAMQSVETAPLDSAAVPSEKSIAVLPFTDMSADKDQEHMSDGIAEEVLNLLAQVPNLKVISRTSSFTFRDGELGVAEIARKLNVAHVLEGSVRTSGNQLRVTAQLIRAADNTHLWSEKYDRPMDDIFAVQEEIANSIVQALQISLMGGGLNRREGGTRNLEAYELFLRADEALNRNTRESLDEAENYIKRAIDLDPNYGNAWDALSDLASVRADNGFISPSEGYEEARRLALRTREISPNLAGLHSRLAYIHLRYDWNWAAASSELDRALKIDPTDAGALNTAGMLAAAQGHWDDAERQLRAAQNSNPLDPYVIWNIAHVYYLADRYTESERTYRQLLSLEPTFGWTRPFLAKTLLRLGRQEEALAILQQEPDELNRLLYLPAVLLSLGRRIEADEALDAQIGIMGETAPVYVAQTFAHRGDNDRAIEWLERAFRQKDPALTEIVGESLLENLADDPRYEAFLRKMNLPQPDG